MQVLETIRSQDNATKKIVQLKDGLVCEVTYIRYPNKDIVCCPTQTSCKMGCKFCFLTSNGEGTVLRNLSAHEMRELVFIAHQEIEYRRPLLVSFMGSGEPLMNWGPMLDACYGIRESEGKENVRFSFATMIPKSKIGAFLNLIGEVASENLNLKAHLSLHFTNDELRAKYMPAAADIALSLSLLETYKRVTGNPVEIHYTLLREENDEYAHACKLAKLLHGRDIPVKILHYSENPSVDAKRSRFVDLFLSDLKALGVQGEYYKPNGLDIGSSCGQFNLDRYVRT